jgi:hypothetical protein
MFPAEVPVPSQVDTPSTRRQVARLASEQNLDTEVVWAAAGAAHALQCADKDCALATWSATHLMALLEHLATLYGPALKNCTRRRSRLTVPRPHAVSWRCVRKETSSTTPRSSC